MGETFWLHTSCTPQVSSDGATMPDRKRLTMSNQEQSAGKMWSGRFREPLDNGFEQWQRSFPFDFRLFQAEIAASTAHARAIRTAGVLTAEEVERMCAGLSAIGKLDVN